MSLNKTIHNLLSELAKIEVIRANQSGKQPTKSFMTYEVKWDKTPDHFHYSKINTQGEQVVSTHVESLLEVQCFGVGAVDRMRELIIKLASYNERVKWVNAGVVIVKEGTLSNLPFLNEAQKFEERAITEISIRHKLTTTDLIDYFNRVEITDEETKQTQIIGVVNGED